MIVLGLRRATPKPSIVLGQIFLLQKPIGLLPWSTMRSSLTTPPVQSPTQHEKLW
jgi:hypothetical protein